MGEKRQSSSDLHTSNDMDYCSLPSKKPRSENFNTSVSYTSQLSLFVKPGNNSNRLDQNRESTLEETFEEFDNVHSTMTSYQGAGQSFIPEEQNSPSNNSKENVSGHTEIILNKAPPRSMESNIEQQSNHDLAPDSTHGVSNNVNPVVADKFKLNSDMASPGNNSVVISNHGPTTNPSFDAVVEDLRNRISRMALIKKEDIVTVNAQYYFVSYSKREDISACILTRRFSLEGRRFVGRKWNLEKGPVYLFFTSDPTRHYSGVGRVLSDLGSKFEIDWLRVIDMPKNRLDGDILDISNAIVQEMHEEYGKPALETMIEYEAESEDKSVLDSIKRSEIPLLKRNVGLRNLGNTCYMNCVLQCLSKLSWKSEASHESDLVREFFRVMYHLSEGGSGHNISSSPVEPQQLKSEIAKFSNRFATYQQQDAHELLLCLLSELNKAMKKHQREGDKNHIQEHFGGKLSNAVEFDCGHQLNNDQTFYSVTLAIPEEYHRKGSVTIYEILESFTKKEVLDEDNMALCLECGGELKQCTIQTGFSKLPSTLILHIQRFQVNSSKRMDTRLRFPINGLLISDTKGESLEYNLFGVCSHFGTLHSGHYTADVRNLESKQWFSCSDSYVREIDLDTRKDDRGFVESDSACILFYKRNEKK